MVVGMAEAAMAEAMVAVMVTEAMVAMAEAAKVEAAKEAARRGGGDGPGMIAFRFSGVVLATREIELNRPALPSLLR